MQELCQQLLKAARRAAGMTIEEAASRLNVAPRTLGYYEANDDAPKYFILDASQVYGDPLLPLKLCRKNCPIGQAYCTCFEVPEDSANIAVLALTLLKHLEDAQINKTPLMDITHDGEIDGMEQPVFQAIMQNLKPLGAAIRNLENYSLAMAPRVKEKAAV